ncbi:MAG: IS3 family transposase [Kineosporiaceae bacterium]
MTGPTFPQWREGTAIEARQFTYGSPRVWTDLFEAGWQVSVNTVARIMHDDRWFARPPCRRRSLAQQAKPALAAHDLLGQASGRRGRTNGGRGNVTYIDAAEGTVYLATVLDLCSRQLLGYAVGDHHDAALTQAAVQMAVARGPRHRILGPWFVTASYPLAVR